MTPPELDPALIPAGIYCYRLTGGTVRREHVRDADGQLIRVTPYDAPQREVCPYWSSVKNRPAQESGYCRFLGRGDWENPGISLLWDQVKECGIRADEDGDNT